MTTEIKVNQHLEWRNKIDLKMTDTYQCIFSIVKSLCFIWYLIVWVLPCLSPRRATIDTPNKNTSTHVNQGTKIPLVRSYLWVKSRTDQ